MYKNHILNTLNFQNYFKKVGDNTRICSQSKGNAQTNPTPCTTITSKGQWWVVVVGSNMSKKPVGFELSSNMHLYYMFDNPIYSFSSTVT